MYTRFATVVFFFLFAFAIQDIQAQTWTIRGTVTDALTDEPLPGANVTIPGTNPLIGTATNQDGEFELINVPLGRHDIKVSFLGYKPVIRTGVLVSSGKETVLHFELEEQVFEGEEITVSPEVDKAEPLNDMAYASSRSFTVEETRRYAGGLDDPSRMATAFAGVSSGGGIQQNALVIRGNAPKNVQWRLQGVEIPNPNHFAGLSVAGGGGLTLFSGQLLADSDFLTSAFPAQYGNALAGVFDINFRSGNTNQREHAAQIGINGLEFASEGPFSGKSNSTYLFNYRYSTLALLMPILPTEGGIQYQDLSFKMDFRTSNAGRFEFWGIGGWDGQQMDPTMDKSEWEYELWDRIKYDMKMGVGATGLSHNIAVGQNSTIKTSLAATVNHTDWQQQRLNQNVELEPNLSIKNTTGRLTARSLLDHRFNKRHLNRTGFSIQHLYYNMGVGIAPDDQPPLSTYIDGVGNSQLIQAFTQSRLNLSPDITLQTGLHSQWFTLNDEITIEPRAGVEWQLTDKSSLNMGYGLHSQLEDLRIYFVQPDAGYPNKSLKMAKAHHFVLGYDLKFNQNTRLKVEAYNQELYDVPVIADRSFSMLNFMQDWTFNDPLVNSGRGRNYGLEITLERFLDDGYYYLLTGTIYNSRYKGGGGEWRNTRFDQDFAFNLLGGKEFMWKDGQRVLGVNGRLSYMGGERYSPIDSKASRNREEVEFIEQRAFEKQFPNRLIADLTVTYRINRNDYASVWALQVKNVLMEKDLSHDYNFQTNQVDLVKEGTPLPFFSYKIEF
ncbi:TonB-dependent receptor [Aliifodinibius salicampi]|uniref:TonB-dependent receptor n=1 Tax=Fodinibius salicampi TaxID=1920655 RepID=A0ABT3PWU0_9BACT|nr:TonB-dependent receptor [Fodinibius salicampi]MCW9712320.1 TonB-dependent receptor [Fodinibius salicampi]